MDWREAMELRIAATKHERFRSLCEADSEHPSESALAWRRRVVEVETGAPATTPTTSPEPPRAYPSLVTQAGNAIGAAAKVIGRAATGRKVFVPADEQARRLAICETCPNFDAAGRRCYLCGCAISLKTRLESFECPVGKW